MVSIARNLPTITNSAKNALFLSMRNYYEKVGQYLPPRDVVRTPLDAVTYDRKMPRDLTYNEVKLWNEDTEDHDFRSQYLHELPDYLSSYFANKYITLLKTKSRKEANTFLRKTIGGNIKPRLDRVNAKYQSTKSSLLAMQFEKQFKKLPTYTRDAVADLGLDISRYFEKFTQHFIDEYTFTLSANEVDSNSLERKLYNAVMGEMQGINIEPPYYAEFKRNKLTNDNALRAVAKITDKEWWYRKLKTRRDFQHEHLAIAVGQVQKKATAYASRDCQAEWLEQKRRNKKYLESMAIENVETGEQIDLDLQVYKSIANPAVRRIELMTRMRGFEDMADEMGYVGAFITLTAPSKYHSAYSKGGFVENWQGNNPRDTQSYLCKTWSRIRAKLSRSEIKFFGFRVAEPHHDGTPHWHILVFIHPDDIKAVFNTIWIYAMDEDGHEKGAATKRFEFTPIDKEKGSATGYIAKYISKNIDGYALDGETDIETGQDLKGMAKAVTAWASRWKIRQFQQIGGAPVTVWRELRRLRNKTIDNDIIDPVLASADIGDWAAYTAHQGGAVVARRDLRVRLSYDENLNQYEETIKKIKGVFSPILGAASFVCTRLIKWAIVNKAQPQRAQHQGLDLKNRAKRAAWSSVNNCTHQSETGSDDQREQIRKNLKIMGLSDDDFTINRLYNREHVRYGAGRFIKLSNTLNNVQLVVTGDPNPKPKEQQTCEIVEFDF